MKLFKRNASQKVTREEFRKLENELRELRHLVFPSEAQGWITIGWGNDSKKDQNAFDKINEKLELLASEAGLEFKRVTDNYELVKPEKK